MRTLKHLSIVITLILCLGLVAAQAGSGPIGFALADARPTQTTAITLSPSAATTGGCETIQVEVWINDVLQLYGADVRLSFDPGTLEVVDADLTRSGVQVQEGGFLEAPLFTTLNTADNTLGTIKYAATQLNPTEPQDGSGVLVVIYLRAKGEGTSSLQFTYTKLADRHGVEIPAAPTGGSATTTALGNPTLSISKLNTTDAQLSWTAVTGQGIAEYHLYRDTAPYFAPVDPPYQTTTALSYDDLGVLGNPATNYYYVARAACDNGFESANSNRMGEFDFALVPGASVGDRKYNFISLALDVPEITDANSLANYVGTGTVYQVMRYDAEDQGFTFPDNVWIPVPGIGNDFSTEVGQVYGLQLQQGAPSNLCLVGAVPPQASITFALVPGAGAGDRKYNYISLPLDRSDLTTADELADDIGEGVVYQVMQYDAEDQGFTFPDNVWIAKFGLGNDFSVYVGYPYMGHLEHGAPTIWPDY